MRETAMPTSPPKNFFLDETLNSDIKINTYCFATQFSVIREILD